MSTEAPTPPAEKAPDRHILKGALFRRQGRRVTLTDAPPSSPPPKPEPVRRPAKVARMLALAHHLQRTIDEGLVADRAAVARKLGLTRARVTQLLDLLLLAPDLQVCVLALEAVDGVEPVAERSVRAVAHGPTWADQRVAWLAPETLGSGQGMVALRLSCRPFGGLASLSVATRSAADHEQTDRHAD